MKGRFYFRSVPFAAMLTAALFVSGSIWQITTLQRHHHVPPAGLPEGQEGSGLSPAKSNLPTLPPATGADSAMLDEQAALDRANAAIQAYCAELGIRTDEDIISVGRYEQLASEGLQFIAAVVSMEQQMSGKPSDGPPVDLPNLLSGWTAKSEIIGRLESEPAKIAKLHAAAVQTALKLDNSTRQAVQAVVAEEFKKLEASQLTKVHRPSEKQPDWYRQRAMALQAAARRIEAVIPADRRQPHVIEQVLTLGTGLQTSTSFDEKSQKGSLNLSYLFPGTKGWRF